MTAATLNKAIQDKLDALSGREGIVGCILVNAEGHFMYSTLPADVDAVRLASIISTLYSNNDVSIQRMNRGNLTQMTLLTDVGVLHIYKIGLHHLLVAFTDPAQELNLAALLQTVEDGCVQLEQLLAAA